MKSGTMRPPLPAGAAILGKVSIKHSVTAVAAAAAAAAGDVARACGRGKIGPTHTSVRRLLRSIFPEEGEKRRDSSDGRCHLMSPCRLSSELD